MTDPSASSNPVNETAPKSSQDQVQDLLARAEAASRAGQRSEARRLFQSVLALDATNEDAWLWLAFLAPSRRQTLAYLEQVRNYHPNSERVRMAREWAASQPPDTDSALAAEPQSRYEPALEAPRRIDVRPPEAFPQQAHRITPSDDATSAARQPARRAPERHPVLRSRWPAIAVVVTTLLLIAFMAALSMRLRSAQGAAWPTPSRVSSTAMPGLVITPAGDMATLRKQASQVVDGQLWDQAIPVLEAMRQLSPQDDGVRQQLAIAQYRYGLQLIDGDHVDEAIAHFDAAIRLYANDKDLQTARRLAVGYRDGRQAVAEKRWDDAVELLTPVYKLVADYRDVADLLFTANVEQARALEAANKLQAAHDAYARAVEIRPDAQEAQARLAEITRILTPPTPTPTPKPRKRIEVSVSQQRLRAYENDTKVFDWVCSTGGVATPTQFGTYQILDKIPEAWSSVWGLRMPYWMGIYYAGASENGIHALPILKNGKVLWSGYLGTRISYGCIVLDTPKAGQLYNWAEIGTTVIVNP